MFNNWHAHWMCSRTTLELGLLLPEFVLTVELQVLVGCVHIIVSLWTPCRNDYLWILCPYSVSYKEHCRHATVSGWQKATYSEGESLVDRNLHLTYFIRPAVSANSEILDLGNAMAENLVISVSRSIVTLSALVIFGNLLEQSHGQWWFPTAPTTTSPSSNSTNPTNSSTNIPPSASFTTPPVMSPSFSFPINPAGSNTSSTATPSTSIGFPTSPYASSSPPTTPTTSTTLIVMSNSFGFGPLTIYTSVQAAIDAVPGDLIPPLYFSHYPMIIEILNWNTDWIPGMILFSDNPWTLQCLTENNTGLVTIEILSGTYT